MIIRLPIAVVVRLDIPLKVVFKGFFAFIVLSLRRWRMGEWPFKNRGGRANQQAGRPNLDEPCSGDLPDLPSRGGASSAGLVRRPLSTRFLAQLALLLGLIAPLTACQITPKSLDDFELAQMADDQLEQLGEGAEPLSKRVTLFEAMARGLKYNLDHRVEQMSSRLANANLELKKRDQLPAFAARGGFDDRSNSAASYSRTLFAGVRSVDPTYSQQDGRFAGDLTLSWHLLDFGLSYVRSKQSADEVLIARERRRSVVNKIVEDIRTAYWKAVSAQRLLDGFRRLRQRSERALRQSRKLYQAGQTSPVTALSYQRELLDIRRQIERLEGRMNTAKLELGALMNVRPGTRFSLHIPKRRLGDLALPHHADQMVSRALENRPELRQLAYRKRINTQEIKASLLELLPGISPYLGANGDANPFLHNASWLSYGTRIGWNVMKAFSYPARRRSLEMRERMLDEQAKAMAMAVVTQVWISRARFLTLQKSARTARDYLSVQRRLQAQVHTSVRTGVASEQTLIREDMNTLLARVEYDLVYADLHNAYAAAFTAMGEDPFDQEMDLEAPVSQIADHLRALWKTRGDRHGS